MHALVRLGMGAGGVTSHPTQVCMQVAQWLMVSLVPRPLPDFISQPWDKIWEWPGDEAS